MVGRRSVISSFRDRLERDGFADVLPALLEPGELVLQGPPKPVKPFGQPCAQARCSYCGLYGALGRCDGCGAPNNPTQLIEATDRHDARPRCIEGRTAFPPNRVVR
jgi:hypothetical protein